MEFLDIIPRHTDDKDDLIIIYKIVLLKNDNSPNK